MKSRLVGLFWSACQVFTAVFYNRLRMDTNFSDYELIDGGLGRKLESFGGVRLIRPEPKARWRPSLPLSDWHADAEFVEHGSSGQWKITGKIPDSWVFRWNSIQLQLKLTPFKHVGVFPEQSSQWQWLQSVIEKEVFSGRAPKILTTFAYTGAATLACAAAGAEVTHVEVSKSTLTWARQNAQLSGLAAARIRWIPEDTITFLQRLVKRGEQYDGVILDPPLFGHAGGKTWKFRRDIEELLELTKKVLSPHPLFVLLNDYAVEDSPAQWQSEFRRIFPSEGQVSAGRLSIHATSGAPELTTGTWVRWQA